MKVLIVYTQKNNIDNPYVSTLYNALKKKGTDIICSVNEFWYSETIYDVIHFQWPEEIINWDYSNPDIINELKQRIDYLHLKGSKFVYTRHNIHAHKNSYIINTIYNIIEMDSDLIIHMGNYSLNNFKQIYPNSNNLIIPHHIYENTYAENIDIKYARTKLNIPNNKFVITCFGAFRNKTEVAMVLSGFLRLKIKNKFLLAPRLVYINKHPKPPKYLKIIISYLIYNILIPFVNLSSKIYIKSGDQLISNQDVPLYLSASDIIFIQRKDILNSGNVPLAFLFQKVVVGPDVGDVGEILRQTKNPTFNPNNIPSIVSAIYKAKHLSEIGLGKINYQYAKENLNINKISDLYINAYKYVLKL